MNDKDYKLHKAMGSVLYLAANVAADFPDDFAKTVATWNADKIAAIIDELEKVRADNGKNKSE